MGSGLVNRVVFELVVTGLVVVRPLVVTVVFVVVVNVFHLSCGLVRVER